MATAQLVAFIAKDQLAAESTSESLTQIAGVPVLAAPQSNGFLAVFTQVELGQEMTRGNEIDISTLARIAGMGFTDPFLIMAPEVDSNQTD